jgi:hypothetical protein
VLLLKAHVEGAVHTPGQLPVVGAVNTLRLGIHYIAAALQHAATPDATRVAEKY